jgi:hypothetical protein
LTRSSVLSHRVEKLALVKQPPVDISFARHAGNVECRVVCH